MLATATMSEPSGPPRPRPRPRPRPAAFAPASADASTNPRASATSFSSRDGGKAIGEEHELSSSSSPALDRGASVASTRLSVGAAPRASITPRPSASSPPRDSTDKQKKEEDDVDRLFNRSRRTYEQRGGRIVLDEETLRRVAEEEEAEAAAAAARGADGGEESDASDVTYDSEGNPSRRRGRKRKSRKERPAGDALPDWLLTQKQNGHRSEEEEEESEDEDGEKAIEISDSDGEGRPSKKRRQRSVQLTPPPEVAESTRQKTLNIVQERFGNALLRQSKLERDVQRSGLPMSFSALRNSELILDPDLAQLYRGSDAKEVRERAIAAAKARETSHAHLKKEQEKAAAADDSEDEFLSSGEGSDSDIEWQPDPNMTVSRSKSKRKRKEAAKGKGKDKVEDKSKDKSEQKDKEVYKEKIGADGAIELLSSDEEDASNKWTSKPIELDDDSDVEEVVEAAPTPSPTPPPAAPEDDGDRIGITLKGNGVEMVAKVKPTTILQNILNHFARTKAAEIPAGKRDHLKLRFDGEMLALSQSIDQAGIEEEDLIEVVW